MGKRFIITFPSSLSAPGGGTVGCLEIASHLEKLGIEIILMPVDETAARQLVPGSRTINSPPSRIHYLLNGTGVAVRVNRLLSKFRVDAVLGWSHEAAFLPAVTRFHRVPLAIFAAHPSYRRQLERRTSLRFLKRRTDEWFCWRPLKAADMVFALSEYTRDELRSLFSLQRVTVAYWGVDPAFTRVCRRRPDGPPRLLFFGSLAPLKGVSDAIRALGSVRARGRNGWIFRIAGWGDEAAVRAACEAESIAEQCEFLGKLDRDGLVRELEGAELAVLPSHSESFGLAIAEAQGAGVPVVSYRTGAVPEVVEDGTTGWLAPAGDTGLLAESIGRVLENPALAWQSGQAAQERIRSRFTWDATARKIADTLESARQVSR